MTDATTPSFGLLGFLRNMMPTRTHTLERVRLPASPEIVYAIGDVHGCLGLLRQLESSIVADAAGSSGEKLIVMLGDYVDRGPHSAQVLDHLLAPPPRGFERRCITGNHDRALLEFLADPAAGEGWLEFGGEATLASYGIDVNHMTPRERAPARLAQRLAAAVPVEHYSFLAGLPGLIETPDYIFVHAGLRPGVRLADQSDADLIWIRDGYAADYAEFNHTVVHGHTPVETPFFRPQSHRSGYRGFATGRLTAVRLAVNKPPIFLSTDDASTIAD